MPIGPRATAKRSGKVPVRKSTLSQKIIRKTRKESIEMQIQARMNRIPLHPNSRRFLKQIISDIEYLRRKGKSEKEITTHLKSVMGQHEVLRKILEDKEEPW